MLIVQHSTSSNITYMSDYRNVFNLTAHRDRKTPDELLSLSIRTAMFVVLLRHGGYFGPKETPYGAVMSQAEAVVAGVLFHTQEGVTYNLHQVSYLHYLHSIYRVSSEYLHSIYTVSTQYLHSI